MSPIVQGLVAPARRRRARRLQSLIETIAQARRRCRIIDLGGEPAYWRGFDLERLRALNVSIVIVNVTPQVSDDPMMTVLHADARALAQFAANSFDLAHSNSVIEHVGEWGGMRAFAEELRRLAPSYYVQTPYFWFPIEPHFLTIGWHYLPPRVRGRLLQRRSYGHRPRVTRPARALELVEEIRLVTAREMRLLFPDAELLRERVGPFTKSLVAHRF
jgi:hypothetical protein